MTRKAHDKIAAGLSDALAFAHGDETKGRIAAPAKAAPRPLTPAQKRALLWLPADGGYCLGYIPHPDKPPFFELLAAGMVEQDRLNSLAGIRVSFRLTPAGQAARKAIEERAADGAQ